MARIKVIIDIDESAVKRDIGTDSLQDAIDAELGLLNDYGQGIAVESWDFADRPSKFAYRPSPKE